MKFRKVLLLFFLLGFGAIVETIHFTRTAINEGNFDGLRDFQIDGDFPFQPARWAGRLMRFRGPSYDFTTSETTDASGISAIEISNVLGDVSVTRSADPKAPIKVTLRKEVFSRRREQAGPYAEKVKLALTRDGSTVRISTNRDSNSDMRMRTHIDVETPTPLNTRVTNRHGKITIEGATAVNASGEFDDIRIVDVTGECIAKNRHANLEVISAANGCRVEVQHGDAHVEKLLGATTIDIEHGNITALDLGALKASLKFGDLQARKIAGALSTMGEHCDLKIEDVKGEVTLNNQGDIDIQNILGRVVIENRRGHVRLMKAALGVLINNTSDDVAVADVGGALEVKNEHGHIRVQRFLKGASLQSDGEDVEASDFAGPLKVVVKRGGVSIKPMRKDLSPMDVSVDIGDVGISLPSAVNALIDAAVERGDVASDSDALKTTEQGKRSLKGTLGAGGVLVKLRSRLGDIKVSGPEGFEVSEPDFPDAPEIERRFKIAPPAPPAGPVMPAPPAPQAPKPAKPTTAPPAPPLPVASPQPSLP